MDTQGLIDTGWVLACAALVFIMQAGFCCLESGLVRTKNSINVAIKNLIDLCVAGLLFWMFGYALMFGTSHSGWFGFSGFFFESVDPHETVRFVFQLMFCGTATTIVAGAVAERMRFSGYLMVAAIISGLIYPVFGHWAWMPVGWLARMGFRDFAGSTVVHGVGAWVALAACLIIGPRLGRFQAGRKTELFGHNVPLATIGVLLLWFGWFGFNGGSALVLDANVPSIVAVTILGGMAGGLAALFISWIVSRQPAVLQVMNGVLAGLVAITCSCNLISISAAVVVGAIGGGISVAVTFAMQKWEVDDVVGAVSVHGCAGIWGTVALALFAPLGSWNTGFSRWEQLGIQSLGATVCFLWSFGVGYAALFLVNRLFPLRVSRSDEQAGLNIAEHGAISETHQLVKEMEAQSRRGDFSQPVSLESYTEIGQIAAQYNSVLSVVNTERRELLQANRNARFANVELEKAKSALEENLQELSEFNDMAVDRELRMIELKKEINDLTTQLGQPHRYVVDFDTDRDADPPVVREGGV